MQVSLPPEFVDEEVGAVDLTACPAWGKIKRYHCRCGKCKVCGNHKHTAVHGPSQGQPPGSKPWGHQFVPATPPTPEQP